MFKLNLRTKILGAVLVFGVAGAILSIAYLNSSANDQVVRLSIDRAHVISTQIRQMRGYYTKNVVAPAKAANLKISQNHKGVDACIPLPATMAHELNKLTSQGGGGFSVRLYSDFPFPWRAKEAAMDDFERAALEFLGKNKDESFWKQTVHDGRESIRLATADLMVAEGCVSCHNSHPETPKNDWKLGDVRGLLAVTVPIDETMAAFKQSSLKSTGIVALAIGLIVLTAMYSLHRVFSNQKRLSQKFQDDILALTDNFGDLSRQLETTSSTVFQSSESTKKAADTVSAASYQASANVQAVGSAAEQLTASIHEINRRTLDAREKSTLASQKAKSSTALVDRLSEAGTEIGEIVSVINSIAEQTNLLALNATIESARAGEAGKGFAVVANEVKELANQTTSATADISQHIKEVQESAETSAHSIREIHTEISELEKISAAVASTVDQQHDAANEIPRSILRNIRRHLQDRARIVPGE